MIDGSKQEVVGINSIFYAKSTTPTKTKEEKKMIFIFAEEKGRPLYREVCVLCAKLVLPMYANYDFSIQVRLDRWKADKTIFNHRALKYSDGGA